MFGWPSSESRCKKFRNESTPSPKWTIKFFLVQCKEEARILCRGGYSAYEQGKEDFEATPPLSHVVLFVWGSQVIFDLAITATSLLRIPGEGLGPCIKQLLTGSV